VLGNVLVVVQDWYSVTYYSHSARNPPPKGPDTESTFACARRAPCVSPSGGNALVSVLLLVNDQVPVRTIVVGFPRWFATRARNVLHRQLYYWKVIRSLDFQCC